MKNTLLVLFLLLTTPLAAEKKVLAFAGSTGSESYNKKLVTLAAKTATKMGATVTVIDLKDYPIPLYDADLEKNQGMPENVKRLRKLMITNDAVIIASPEYNASVTAVLKNALDWASRSEDAKYSPEAFVGKKFAIMSASPGRTGGAKGLIHLRTIIEAVGGAVVKQQVSIADAANAFDDKGDLKDELSKEELQLEIRDLLR